MNNIFEWGEKMPESPSKFSDDSSVPATLKPDLRQAAAHRFRWYHFYFFLAFFDLVVIIASLTLYHATLTSYTVALDDVNRIDRTHLWVQDLRRTIIDLNAPGNDIFATRLVGKERMRFDIARSELSHLVARENEFGIDLRSVRGHVERMVGDEERIFKIFEQLVDSRHLNIRERNQLKQESNASMAAMDRAQADALRSSSEIEDALLADKNRLLDAYGRDLERSANFEKFFVAILILILAGIFYYGRKLHRTHERMLESEQRTVAERQLRLADLGTVCSSVAHGIRNPLASITSSAELALTNGNIDDATREHLQDVLSEGQRLGERISRLLDFSRPTNQAFKHLDVKEVIEQAIAEVKPTLDKRNVRIDTDFDFNGHSAAIFGDQDLLAQSFIEVLSNSLDHIESDGWIGIVCRFGTDRPGFVCINFFDNGPGIDNHIRPRVFDLFFTAKAGGTGVGLASVKRSVERHGGEVAVLNNNDGGGAHIRFLLPVA